MEGDAAGGERWRLRFDVAEAERWRAVDDVVMGGVSSSALRPSEGGARFAGELSLERGGGFASVRREIDLDLADAAGIVVRARGDGRIYQLRLRTDATLADVPDAPERGDAISWAARFESGSGWREHELRWEAFAPTFRGRDLPGAPPLDPGRIRSLSLMVADEQAGAFGLELAHLAALPRAAAP